MPWDVPRETFDRLLERAIADLPAKFASALQLVRVEVVDRPTARQLESVGLSEEELLLGLYDGVPLPERHIGDGPTPPDVIYLFREDLSEVAESADDLAEQIRITLLHELGHYFGFGEDELDELGYA